MGKRKTGQPVALTIAGFDPGSGAGITADLKTFAAHQVYGVACISALTVQSTQGVRAVEPLPPDLVRQTLDCLVEDLALSGIKIGMLGNAGIAAEVVSFLKRESGKPVVLDPVLCSTSGTPLLDANGIHVLKDQLLHQVNWITPNIQELGMLVGDSGKVPALALQLQENARRHGNDRLNVVVTGGDCVRPDDFLLTSSGEQYWLTGEKIETTSTHGTGCAFSSALLCGVIAGLGPKEAAIAAKAYVTEALRAAYPIGKGKGHMHHLYAFDPEI